MARINKDEVDRFHDYNIYIPSRLIYMGSAQSDSDMNESGTDYLMAEILIKNISILEHISQDPITIVMNNIGGCEESGYAIYDKIKQSKCHITIKVYGSAQSMGAIILQAADVRIMSPNSKFMFHYGSVGMEAVHTKIMQKWAEDSAKMNLVMENIFMEKILEKNPDFAHKKLKKLLDFDTILTAQETIALGLADNIEGQDGTGK